ncbi:MAG: efflux RND transporter periplasmic adaptor subunit [Sphingobacteriales bacterium]|nr:efflux RND transporter periplasmic adaptor subunit [Sphingobacteriales bacterium]
MNYKIIIPFISAFMIGCSNQQPKQAEPEQKETNVVSLTDAQIKNAGIETGTAEKRSINGTLKLNGLVDVPPQNLVSVSFPLGGYLKTTQLLPGMPVKKGEVIGVLEDQSFIQLQQDYLIGKTKLQLLQQEAERQRILNESKANSDKILQQTEAELQSQKVLVKGLSEKLKLIGINPDKLNGDNISRSVAITSPITGFVSKVNVNIGKYVTPTDVLFELVNPNDIHAAITVFEKDINQLKIGQKVIISLVDKPETKYNASIILISKSLDENRSAIIHCHFEKEDHSLLPGMFLNAAIEITNNNATAVMDEAVVRYANKFYVFEEKAKNQFEMKEVETGVSHEGFTEIKNGSLLLNKRIAIKNAYAILSQMKNKSEE